MNIAIDCDPAATELKDALLAHLQERGADVTDLAFLASADGHYPDVAFNLARRIAAGDFDRGILLCGTGLGMAMCACKVPGVWAGTCHDVYSAQRLRMSNDAQVITMGQRVVGEELAKTILDAWLESEFAGGRSAPKVQRMRELESETLSEADNSKPPKCG